jgi:hypothetical protein
MEEYQQTGKNNPSHILSSLPCCTGVHHHEQISAKEQTQDEWKWTLSAFQEGVEPFLAHTTHSNADD